MKKMLKVLGNVNLLVVVAYLVCAVMLYLPVTTYPIQDTEPIQQNTNELWFDTSVGNNNYYQLESLANPATASDIASGKEAYNQIGQLIVGTAN